MRWLAGVVATLLVASQATADLGVDEEFNLAAFNSFVRAQNPTLWLSTDDRSDITVDSVGRASAWASRTGSISFTQGTDGNKPVLSRSDQVENLVLYSEDFTNAVWNKAGYPVTFSAPTLTATAGANRHGMYNAAPEARIGVSYRLTVDIEKGTHQYISIGDLGDFAWHTAVLDINAGTLGTTLNATSSVVANGTDRYLFSIDYTRTNGGALNPIICFVAASTTTQCASFTAAGTETVKVYSAQIRRTSTQPTYVATTAAPVYGSFTGRRGLVFDGSSDRMGSTSLFSDIWTNSVKEVFAVAVPGESSMVNANILTTASHYAALEIGTAYPAFYNYDGSGDRAEDTAYSRGTPYVLHGRHAGGSIYYSKDNGVEISASSGNTTNTTDTLSLGARSASEYWTGDILEVVTFNRTLQPSVRDRIISGLRIKHGI